jgi:hypothetical protein
VTPRDYTSRQKPLFHWDSGFSLLNHIDSRDISRTKRAEYKRQAAQLKVEQEQKRAERKAKQAAKREEKPQTDKSE